MELLSIKDLKWLKSVDYQNRSHEEREILIKAARILFHDDEE